MSRPPALHQGLRHCRGGGLAPFPPGHHPPRGLGGHFRGSGVGAKPGPGCCRVIAPVGREAPKHRKRGRRVQSQRPLCYS